MKSIQLQNQETSFTSVLEQVKAHSSRSEKYHVIQTGDVIKQFEKVGFNAKLVQQEKSTSKYRGFGTHLIKLTHDDLKFENILNQEIQPVLYFKNSYHGRTRAVFDLGLFRMYCLNGLILGDAIRTIPLVHRGNKTNDVKNAIEEMRVLFQSEVAELVMTLKDTQMSRVDQFEYAEKAFRQRLENRQDIISTNSEELLHSHRSEDNGNSAWLVYNRVQENLGLNYRKRPEGINLSYTYMKDENGEKIEKERNLSLLKNIGKVNTLNQYLFSEIKDYATKTKVELANVA